MSVVTNVILTFPLVSGEGDTELVDKLNAHLKTTPVANGLAAWFRLIPDEGTGGTRCVETNICVSAFNHLNLDGLVGLIQSFDWPEKENVQVFVQEDNDNRFREIQL